MLDVATNLNIINKSGAWFAYESNKIGQGRENAKNYLKEHPEIFDEVERKVREHYNLGQGKEQGDAQVGEDASSKASSDKNKALMEKGEEAEGLEEIEEAEEIEIGTEAE